MEVRKKNIFEKSLVLPFFTCINGRESPPQKIKPPAYQSLQEESDQESDVHGASTKTVRQTIFNPVDTNGVTPGDLKKSKK